MKILSGGGSILLGDDDGMYTLDDDELIPQPAPDGTEVTYERAQQHAAFVRAAKWDCPPAFDESGNFGISLPDDWKVGDQLPALTTMFVGDDPVLVSADDPPSLHVLSEKFIEWADDMKSIRPNHRRSN